MVSERPEDSGTGIKNSASPHSKVALKILSPSKLTVGWGLPAARESKENRIGRGQTMSSYDRLMEEGRLPFMYGREIIVNIDTLFNHKNNKGSFECQRPKDIKCKAIDGYARYNQSWSMLDIFMNQNFIMCIGRNDVLIWHTKNSKIRR